MNTREVAAERLMAVVNSVRGHGRDDETTRQVALEAVDAIVAIGREPEAPPHAFLAVRTLDQLDPDTLLVVGCRDGEWREVGRVRLEPPAPGGA